NCSWIGIGIELPHLLSEQSIKINKEILAINPDSYEFSPSNRPHLNLYDLDVPESKISEIIISLGDVLKDKASFEVKILNINYFQFGAIFLELERHPALLDLHSAIVLAVAPYRGNCMCKDYLQPWRKYTQEQEKLLNAYGNPFVLNEFHPHISLGFIRAPE